MKLCFYASLSISILLLITFCPQKSAAQDYLGLSSGNYAGVSGVSLQPASIADSRLKWDLNLFSIDVNYNNNFFYVKKDALLKNKFFKSPYKNDFNAVKRDLLKTSSSNDPVYVRMNTTVQLPSLMFTTGKRSAMALNIRSRTATQFDNISPDLARMIYNNFQYEPGQGQSFTMNNSRVNILSWLEVGLTYARVLYNDGPHFLKFGFTGKYLGGVASGYMNSDQINFAFNSDSTLSANTDNVNYGHSSKFDLDFANRKNYSPDGSAFGYDIGLVYEFRGNIDRFKFWKYNEAGDPELSERRDKNKYLFKIGLSYLNGGSLDFTKPDNVNDFSADVNNYNFAAVHAHTINDVDAALAQVVNLKNGNRNYTVELPHALSAQIDLKLVKGFYMNLMGYFPINNSTGSASRITAVRTYAITPRWENRWFGIYVPLSFNEFHDTNLGATLRIGPLIVGSSNLGSVLFKDNLKAADFHVGIKIPVGYGKPSKAYRKFNKFYREKIASASHKSLMQTDTSNNNQNDTLLLRKIDSLQQEVNNFKQQKNQQEPPVYQAPTTPITININNYGGGSTMENKPAIQQLDTLQAHNQQLQDEMRRMQQQYMNINYKDSTDSVSARRDSAFGYQQRRARPDTLQYTINNNPNAATPATYDSAAYDSAVYRLQRQNNQLMQQMQLLSNEIQQQKVDSQANKIRQQQLDTMMQKINEQDARVKELEDSLKKKQ